MKTLQCCLPRQSVFDGSKYFIVKISALQELTEGKAVEFLNANVLTSGMEDLIIQTLDRLSGGPSRGIFKLCESIGGGKTQSMIVCGLLARFPKLAAGLPFKKASKSVFPDHVTAFTNRHTDKNVWVTLGEVFGVDFPEDSAPSEKQWAALMKDKCDLILLDELAIYLASGLPRILCYSRLPRHGKWPGYGKRRFKPEFPPRIDGCPCHPRDSSPMSFRSQKKLDHYALHHAIR